MIYEKISGFADEMGSSLEEQIQGTGMMGLSCMVIRNIRGRNIGAFSPAEVKKEIVPLLDKSGMKVSALGSLLGKISADDKEAFDRQLEQAESLARTAEILDCPHVRLFSFYIPEGTEPQKWRTRVLEQLGKFVDIFARRGVTALCENEKGLYGDTALRHGDLFGQIRSQYLKAAFDFANFVQCKEDPLEAYHVLKPFITEFHIKDARYQDGENVVCGSGDGRITEILKDVFKSGFEGFLTLEPHLVLFDGLSLLERRKAETVIGKNKAESGLDAFRIQRDALERILENIFTDGARKGQI